MQNEGGVDKPSAKCYSRSMPNQDRVLDILAKRSEVTTRSLINLSLINLSFKFN